MFWSRSLGQCQNLAMIRDPFYHQIIEGLSRPLDGQIFERCAANLLRLPFPGIVPIPGGADSGMDGAVPDGEGLAYPLVATTNADVIGNLTRNLNQYLKDGGERRKVVLVTSQALTARRRRNLERRAKELGFVPVQIYDRAAIADLLYRDSRWCYELLGLSGAPPALSDIPRGQRPFPEQPLVGRESDLQWLATASENVLLVGQPGCGKTSVLRALARQGIGLFVNSDNLEAIANGIRDCQPTILFLDDAHTDLETLRGLQALRNETHHQFRIIATSWPGASRTVSERMGLPSHAVRTLELLDRDQIVKVVKAAGAHGPTWLVAQIVTQAAGRPGLAATLAFLCRHGDIQDVLTGDALVRFVGPSLEGVVGRDALAVLAAFALGGDAGMPLDEVADVLGLSPLDATRLVRDLSAVGVITEEWTGNLSVIPYALRHVLVRDQFFAGPTALPFPALLSKVPRRRDALLTLIGARSAGAAIPDASLLPHVEELRSTEAWEAFAGLGPEQAEEALERYRDDPTPIAAPLLAHVPELVIPALLMAASGGPWFLHHLPAPLKALEDWVERAYPGRGIAVPRRMVLQDALRRWLSPSADQRVGFEALRVALSPRVSMAESDPGRGNTFTLREGLLTDEELLELRDTWPQALEIIRSASALYWPAVLRLLHSWAYPWQPFERSVSEETRSLMRDGAAQMLRDVLCLAPMHQGLHQRAERLVRDLNADIPLALDPEFAVLFPGDPADALGGDFDMSRFDAALQEQGDEVRHLATVLSSEEPGAVATRIARFDREAAAAEHSWPRHTPLLASELAQRGERPEAWLQATIDARCASDVVVPFLIAAIQASPTSADWENLAGRCLEQPTLVSAALYALITHPAPPARLLTRALQTAGPFEVLVEVCCRQGRVPSETLRALLAHDDSTVAGAAAVGAWLSSGGSVRPECAREWHAAVLRMPDGDHKRAHVLGRMLSSDPGLARDWLVERLIRGEPFHFVYPDGPVKRAVAALDADARWVVLAAVPDHWGTEELIATLVGDDLDLFGRWLATTYDTARRLAPLAGRPTDAWAAKAKFAHRSGVRIDTIIRAAWTHRHSWTGEESDYWASWERDFARLSNHEDPDIRRIAERGRKAAAERRADALRAARREDVYGTR